MLFFINNFSNFCSPQSEFCSISFPGPATCTMSKLHLIHRDKFPFERVSLQFKKRH